MTFMPAHKVVGDVGKPGQIVNPHTIKTDIVDRIDPPKVAPLPVAPAGLNLSDPNDRNRFRPHADVRATWAKFGYVPTQRSAA